MVERNFFLIILEKKQTDEGLSYFMKDHKLLHLLKKKKGFFEAILELSEMEKGLSVPEWIDVLEQKKILLSCIEEIDKELAPFKESLTHLTQEISEELDHIRIVIKQILHLDAQNQEKRKRELKIHGEGASPT